MIDHNMGDMADLLMYSDPFPDDTDPGDGPYYPIKIRMKEGEKCSCGGKFIKRTNKRTRVTFLGCSNFPKCKRSSPL